MVLSDPLQYILVIPKFFESLLFFLNILLSIRVYRDIPWNGRPIVNRLLIIGMSGWLVYIFLDIFIYLIAPISMDGVIAPAYFIGYDIRYPSLTFANILRDFAFAGACIILWSYFLIALIIRYGEAATFKILKNHPSIVIFILFSSILFIINDQVGVSITETQVKVNAVFTGISGISLITFILFYFLSAILLNRSFQIGFSIDPTMMEKLKVRINALTTGIFFMGFGNLYWVILGLIQGIVPGLNTEFYRVILHFLGHAIWATSPILMYYGLRRPLKITPKKEDYERIARDKIHIFIGDNIFGSVIFKGDNIVYVNKFAADFFEYTQDELEKIDYPQFLKFVYPDDYQSVVDYYVSILQHQSEMNKIDFRAITKSGKIKWLHLYAISYIYNNDLILQSMFLDISTQKQLEEKIHDSEINTAKMESIALLAGGIAHDYNNILTAILGNVNLMQSSENCSKDFLELLKDVETATKQAQQLNTQLLTFAKGGTPIKSPCNIINILNNTISLFSHGSKSICKIESQLENPIINCDEGQIAQVISNLLINADQAMENGGTITIVLKNVFISAKSILNLAEGHYIQISIQDHGSGILKANREKIFIPYFSTKSKGTGLGLATSYSIIKRHGGIINFDSEQGKGTTFHIYLPLTPSTQTIKTLEEKQDFHGSGKILIMDDDINIQKVLEKMLKLCGFETESVTDGEKAIILYEQALQLKKPFKAVIIDLTIPGGMGGKETVARLHQIDPNIIAIVSSGYSSDDVMANYQKYFFKGVLPKPYSMSQLKKVLRELFPL